MAEIIKTSVAIVGAGIAGYSAAMYAGRLGLEVTIFDAKPGGAIMLTDSIENYPGFKSLTGMELSNKIKEHAMVFKPNIINSHVQKIIRKGGCFQIQTKKENYMAKAVIITTGTEWRKLRVPGEEELTGKGVHYCALCDGPFYKEKTVAVIGGGDSAIKEAITLAEHAKKVFIIYRKENIRPEPINKIRLEKLKNIEIISNTNVLEILGKEKLEKIRLDKPYKNSKELELDGIFVDIGHIPMAGLVEPLGVKLNEKKEIIVNKLMETNVPGIFPAGDVTDSPFKQAITAAAEGSVAAFSTYNYITKNPICEM
jgi:thioredoxin reductase (NADPH)